VNFTWSLIQAPHFIINLNEYTEDKQKFVLSAVVRVTSMAHSVK